MQTDERRTLVFILSTFFLLLIFALPFAASGAVQAPDRCRQLLSRVKSGPVEQLMLDSRQERFLLGLLVETKRMPRLLALGSYLSSHEALSQHLEKVGGRIVSYLWGGELALFNPGLRRDVGYLKAANDSCGFISFLEKRKASDGESYNGPQIRNSNRYLKFIIENACTVLSHDSYPVDMIEWSNGHDGNRHLHPKLNGTGENFRHSAINALFDLRMMDSLGRARLLTNPTFLRSVHRINILVELMREAHPAIGNFDPVLRAHQRILKGEFVSSEEIATLMIAYHVLNENLHSLDEVVTIVNVN